MVVLVALLDSKKSGSSLLIYNNYMNNLCSAMLKASPVAKLWYVAVELEQGAV